jgi:hypothetical protein
MHFVLLLQMSLHDDRKKLRESTQYLRNAKAADIKTAMFQICSNRNLPSQNSHLSKEELAAVVPHKSDDSKTWNPVFPIGKPLIAPYAAGTRDRPQVRLDAANKKKIYCTHVACNTFFCFVVANFFVWPSPSCR